MLTIKSMFQPKMHWIKASLCVKIYMKPKWADYNHFCMSIIIEVFWMLYNWKVLVCEYEYITTHIHTHTNYTFCKTYFLANIFLAIIRRRMHTNNGEM